MNYHLVSTDAILGKVFRDTDIRYTGWENDAVEWIGECLDKVGHFQDDRILQAEAEVCNFSCPTPKFISKLDAVWVQQSNGGWIPVDYDNENYEEGYLLNQQKTSFSYRVEPGQLIFSFETGTVGLVYRSICVDSRGYPLVPDISPFSEACFWYILMRLMVKDYYMPPAHTKIDYPFARLEYARYLEQARSRLKMVTPDQMDAIARQWSGASPKMTDAKRLSYIEQGNTNGGNAFQTTGESGYGTKAYEPTIVPPNSTTEEEPAEEVNEPVVDPMNCDVQTTALEETLSQPQIIGIQFRFLNPPVRVVQSNGEGLDFQIEYVTNVAVGTVDLADFPAGAVYTLASSKIRITIPSFSGDFLTASVTVYGTAITIKIEEGV